MLAQLRKWENGYTPCRGTEMERVMEELVAKRYAHKSINPGGSANYYAGAK